MNELLNESQNSTLLELYVGEDSNLSLAQSDSCAATSDSIDRKSRRSESGKSRLISRVVTPDIIISDLHEYRWPPDDAEGHVPCRGNDKETADYFVLQEVLSSILQIKSFKRRYPDLYRRPVDGWEKDWLVKKNMLPKGVGDLGLTALRSDEILALLERDYPDMHEQVVGLFHERKIQLFADQQKEQYQDIIYQTSKTERGSKLDLIRKKAVKSAAEYNRSLNHDRRKERLYYWDLQTMQIHVSHPRLQVGRNLARKPQLLDTKGMGDYPVSILPGQYCSRYRQFPNGGKYDLGYLPLNSAIYTLPDLEALKVANAQDEAAAATAAAAAAAAASAAAAVAASAENAVSKANMSENSNNGTVNVTALNNGSVNNSEAVNNNSNSTTNDTVLNNSETSMNGSDSFLCSKCRIKCVDRSIRCHQCGKFGHPDCMDIKDFMIPFIRQYQWCCIDCKRCHICDKSTDEEQMMFCDRCDRGYHVFCVGLNQIPEGNWECSNCFITAAAVPRR